MNKKKRDRAILFGGIFIAAAGATALTLTALSGSITYFYTPSELNALDQSPRNAIRLGGLVANDSVTYAKAVDGDSVFFTIEDTTETVDVRYAGILPDLFREGQGVVVQGRLGTDGTLVADTVLAKHDENYMPREVAEALKEQGVWKDTGTADKPSSGTGY